MPVDKRSKNTLEVEMVSVDIDDAEERLRLAYRLLLKSASCNTVTVKGNRPNQPGGCSE